MCQSGLHLSCVSQYTLQQESKYASSLLIHDKDRLCFLDMLNQSQELDYPEGDYYIFCLLSETQSFRDSR